MEKMPKILSCDVVGCSYNSNKECCASAITIGDPVASCDLSHPACDTYSASAKKGGSSASDSAVAPASQTAVSSTRSWNAAPRESMSASTATMPTVRPFNRARDMDFDRSPLDGTAFIDGYGFLKDNLEINIFFLTGTSMP